jgi:sn-glycerol 3-phosphate transport system ATP-binding protein
MNLFPLHRRGDFMVLAGTDGPVLAPAIQDAATGGIRPEDLRLGAHGIPAVVEHAEYLGADTILGCRAGEATLLARLPGHVVQPPGTAVRLQMTAAVAVFDAASGRRLHDLPHLVTEESFA